MVESTHSLHVEVGGAESQHELTSESSAVRLERKKRYKLGKILDHGSFGIVYEGTDTLTSNPVAIKQIWLDHRFQFRELEILQEVDGHQHIMKLSDYYYSNNDPGKDRFIFLVSPLYPENLTSYIRRIKKRSEASHSTLDQMPLP